jgi:magnesium-transporting ATPase (P-type)
MAGMTVLCSDKTGTLTLNKMAIQEETPAYLPGENQQSILRYAAMAAKWKEVRHCVNWNSDAEPACSRRVMRWTLWY